MGREVKRVPLNFDWPINEVWRGYINPYHCAKKCAACEGTGLSITARELHDLWYGYRPFKPEDRGSTPFLATDAHVVAFAQRNVERSPEYYQGKLGLTAERAVEREAARLCGHWNGSWSHHLNQTDVEALVAAGRLYDFTHIWTRGTGWAPKEPSYIPSAREVNIWSCVSMGHDSINRWVCIKAECERLGESHECAMCDGESELWPSSEAKAKYDAWNPEEPPTGDGYQIWETVSEGSPISPPFSTPEDLARHMATTRWGGDKGTPYETWLKFIRGDGWAPSFVATDKGLQDGVTAVTSP